MFALVCVGKMFEFEVTLTQLIARRSSHVLIIMWHLCFNSLNSLLRLIDLNTNSYWSRWLIREPHLSKHGIPREEENINQNNIY